MSILIYVYIYIYLFLFSAEQEFVLHVEVSDYLEKLVEQACIHIYVMGKVKKSNQLFVTDAAFRLRRPDLIIQVIMFTNSQLYPYYFTNACEIQHPL